MKHYIFREGHPDPTYAFDFEQSLFNLHNHRLLQAEVAWRSFYVLNEKNHQVSAALHFNIKDRIASSPCRAPFGSVDFSSSLPPNILFDFLQFAEDQLKQTGVKKIVIKNPPQMLRERQGSLLSAFLFNLGYHVSDAEIGSIIRVGDDSFENIINQAKRKLLHQAHDHLVFRPMERQHFSEVYNFILNCVERKGYLLSMSHDQLQSAFDAFPTRYKLFVVQQDNQFTAASVAINVTSDIVYNFYAAHDEAFDHVSPMVMLIEGLYDFCRNANIPFLDLGTSAVNRKPNFGLLAFKFHLGGTPTPKLTFEKTIT